MSVTERFRSVDTVSTVCRKEVVFEDGKVLLSRLGDNIHATSAFCTHYGAPLAKGVMTADGRVVWYVADSSVCRIAHEHLTVHGMEVQCLCSYLVASN